MVQFHLVHLPEITGKEKIPMETISRITHYSLDQIQKLGKLHGLL